MQAEEPLARCSQCGAEAPRGDMFGAEPDLLCEACAHGIRRRLAPAPVDRRMEIFAQHTVPITVATLGTAVVLYVLGSERTFPLLSMVRPSTTLDGFLATLHEPWRLLTSAFLHGGFFHLLMNSFALWYFGRVVEMRWGSPVVAAVLIGSAVMGGAAAWIFSWFAVGLSGALFGLAAFLFAQRKVDPLAAAVMSPYMTRQLIAWLLLSVVLSETGAWRISNWGHGGGLVFGLVAGFAWRLPYRWMWYVVVVLLTGGAVATVLLNGTPGWVSKLAVVK